MRCHFISILSVLAAVPPGSLAKPPSLRWEDMYTRHSWKAVPKNWESLGRPPNSTIIDLYFALKPYRENALIDTLYEVSSPGHPRYRAYLSKEQVAELVVPHPNTLKLVNSWLEHHNVPSSSVSMTHNGNTMMLKGVSVTQANTLLNASYQVYKHIESSKTIVRTVGYALPAALQGHVLTVVPTTSFLSAPTRRQAPRNRSGRAAAGLVKSVSGEPPTRLSNGYADDVDYLTPPFLRWLYDIYTYTPIAMNRNALGIAGYSEHYPSPADLARFMLEYRYDGADATFIVELVNSGEYNPSQPNYEANLNLQYAMAMAYPTPVIFYSIGDGPSGTEIGFTSWLEYLLDRPRIPQTISTTYSYYESSYSREHAKYECELFAQLALLGVTVLFASGDFGVGGGDCVTENGSVQFIPEFPATCPWLTVVGGTTGYGPEIAASLSGGGFSNYFERPDYQEQAVSTFLRNIRNQHQGLFNDTGRGFPDIAAQAVGFRIILNGNEFDLNGTSGAAPVVAALISMLNDYLLSIGQAPLGFLNYWLYGSGRRGLVDVKSGSNPGCNTDGFSATGGWDPVTGLGTPSLYEMLGALWVDLVRGVS